MLLRFKLKLVGIGIYLKFIHTSIILYVLKLIFDHFMAWLYIALPGTSSRRNPRLLYPSIL